MRLLGWILGALFTLDGLTSLIGGRKILKWAGKTVGRKLPHQVHGWFNMDDVTTRTWGVNNVLAGLSLVAIAATGARRRR